MGKDPYFKHNAIRFKCRACGACCRDWEGSVYVRDEEIALLARHLKMPVRRFRSKFVRALEDGDLTLALTREGWCPMLGSDGRCAVHQVKPTLCRNFPVWEDLVGSEQAYNAYEDLCPGLGEGDEIPEQEISRRLKENRAEPAGSGSRPEGSGAPGKQRKIKGMDLLKGCKGSR